MTKTIFTTFALVAALSACTQIDTGNVGVERTLGNVKSEELLPGVYQTFTKTVDEFTGKEVPLQINDLKPKTRDNLTMTDVDIDVYVKVKPGKMADLFIKYQGDVSVVMKPDQSGQLKETDDKIVGMGRVLREARESVYSCIAGFDAPTIHLKRDDIAACVRARTQSELNKSDPDAFEVTTANVRNLLTDPALEKSIRARAEVDQLVAAKLKENELAEAEAKRLLTEANGRAAANRALAESATPALLRLKEIEAQLAVSMSNGAHTIFVPYGQAVSPIINTK